MIKSEVFHRKGDRERRRVFIGLSSLPASYLARGAAREVKHLSIEIQSSYSVDFRRESPTECYVLKSRQQNVGR